MKRKLLSVTLAASLAVTSFAALAVTAGAEEEVWTISTKEDTSETAIDNAASLWEVTVDIKDGESVMETIGFTVNGFSKIRESETPNITGRTSVVLGLVVSAPSSDVTSLDAAVNGINVPARFNGEVIQGVEED